MGVVDAVMDAALTRPQPSAQARILAWAGGTLTVGQADQALAVLGEHADQMDDPNVTRAGGLARLKDPASAHIRAQEGLLSAADRRPLAVAVLGEAARLTSDPDATLIDRTVARLATHRVRAYLAPTADLTRMQCLLIRGLEQLGDPEAAYQVAKSALAELPEGPQSAAQRTELLKAWLRLAQTRPPQPDDPWINEAITLATTSGALLGPEAHVWAAVNLLQRPGPHGAALPLIHQITTELGTYPGHDPTANHWRLLLTFHTGQAGYPGAAEKLLAPVTSGGTIDQQDAAQAVRRAIEDRRADIRLQIIVLETELQATPETADDDRLRIHHVLARDYHQIGSYEYALRHGAEELRYRLRLQNPDHPDVLINRHNVAYWTSECGDARGALQLLRELLPDRVRVLGPDHPSVLTTRANIANCTGECGDAHGALQLFRELLPDRLRVLGPDHPSVLTTRNRIAYWTGKCGDARGALQLFRELLPDRVRVLGPDHPSVLTTRNDIAAYTGECGDAQGALQLFQDLLPDRVPDAGLRPPGGPNHPRQHCRLDGRVRGRPRRLATVPGAATTPDPGAGRQPSQGPNHP